MTTNPTCQCGHSWETHHLGCVMNPSYYTYPLTIRGCAAQECEKDQINGSFLVPVSKACLCGHFRPKSKKLQKLIKEWRSANPNA